MKYLLLMLFPTVAWAGQAEYAREVGKEYAEYVYALSVCNRLPTKAEAAQCVKETRKRHKEVLAGLRKYHLEK